MNEWTRKYGHVMMIQGCYGAEFTPCDVLTYDNQDGTTWYCVRGSVNVNLCETAYIKDDMDVEELPDIDVFTWSSPIDSVYELIEAVEY